LTKLTAKSLLIKFSKIP